MEHHEGFGYPASDAEGTTTGEPERDLQPGDPNLLGAAPAEEKKGIVGRVKDMVGRHGRKKHGARNPDATSSTEYTEAATKNGIVQKIKAKASSKVGHGPDGSKHGPARLLSMSSSSSSMSSSDEEDIGTVGFAMDPTGPAVAGSTLEREDFSSASQGPGAGFRDLTLNSDDDANGDETDQHSEHAPEYANSSNPVNPNSADAPPTEMRNSTLTRSEEDTHGGSYHAQSSKMSNSNLTPSEDAQDGLHDHSHPTEMANRSNQNASDSGEPYSLNCEKGAMVGDHHGNLHDGPRGDSLKQDGVVHKVLDKVH